MEHIHHITPRHVWLSRFGNLKGFNAPDNKVILTIEQHAQAHQFLYELHGKIQDKLARNFLLGALNKQEVLAELNRNRDRSGCKNPMFGKRHSKETRELISSKRKGFLATEETKIKIRNAHIGLPQSDNKKEKCRLAAMGNKANLGKKFSVEHREKIRQSQLRFIQSKKVSI